MKDTTKLGKKQTQWLWFIALWVLGLASAVIIGQLTRWIMKIGD